MRNNDLYGNSDAYVRMSLPDAELGFLPSFLSAARSTELLRLALSGIEFAQPTARIFGREHKVPRLTCWFGDPNARYTYSGIENEPLPWPTWLFELKRLVEEECGQTFNSVLANMYRDGNDRLGWHADDEPELGVRPVIASVSLGATRSFRMKHRFRADVPPHCIDLPSGSLLVMAGNTQQYWHHSVPKRTKVRDPRVNLTFRRIY